MTKHVVGPTTDRLTLRAMTEDDAEAFYRLNSNAEVMRFTHEPLMPSVEAARNAIASYPDFDRYGYGRWGCFLKAGGPMIGFCGLKYLPEFDAVDIGYRLLPEFWGRGLATEAARATIAFGFDTLKLKQIIALTIAENAGSIRVLEKIGMRLEGEVAYDGVTPLKYVIDAGARG